MREAAARVASAIENQRLIDELWDFADPSASEERFRLAAAAEGKTELEVDILFTQVARALGLQGRYEEALAILTILAMRTSLNSLSARSSSAGGS
ncbi:MAG: hypothetical protein WD830_02150 [Chloroflexota bacterium]